MDEVVSEVDEVVSEEKGRVIQLEEGDSGMAVSRDGCDCPWLLKIWGMGWGIGELACFCLFQVGSGLLQGCILNMIIKML